MNKSASIIGCGWLGLPLAEHLLKAGYQVKGSTTQIDKLKSLQEKGIEPYLIDLSKEGSIAPSFFESDLFVVTVPPRSRTQPAGVYLAQMKRMAAFIEQYPQIKQVIYTSSTSVYPDRAGFAKEESVCLPQQSSHAELVEVENAFLALSTATVTILRLGGLTGGSRLLVKHFAGKKELLGGHYPVNLLHLQDAVRIIDFVSEHALAGVFNACSPQHPYKKDFYRTLAERFQMVLPEFRADQEEGKTIATDKLQKIGYVFSFEDPSAYTYDEDLN